MEDLEGLAGLKRSKGGSNDTEPAYLVKRASCYRWVGIGILMFLIASAWLWRSDALLRKMSPRLAARRTTIRMNQHSTHARFAKLGQELESHLELDMRERDAAMKLRSKLRQLEKSHRANVTRALDAAAIGTETFTFERRNAVASYMESSIESLFDELRRVLEQRIVRPMILTSSAAYIRQKELHDEILDELRRDRDERESFLSKSRNARGDLDGDGFVEDRDYDGSVDIMVDERFDDAASERQDEEWRKELITNFANSFEAHFNDAISKAKGVEPRSLLKTNDQLFYELVDLQKKLGFDKAYVDPDDNFTAPTLSWRDAEDQLVKLKPELLQHRCHTFEPSGALEDDEFDYVQLRNVEHFLAEMIWHARVNSSQDLIWSILHGYKFGRLDTLETIEALERAEGDGVFPSFWLYHPHVDDYLYGHW